MREKACATRETATFRGDDPDCLVDAGLACRGCLSAQVELTLELEPWEERARLRCRSCGRPGGLALTGDQALRLSLRRASAAPSAAPSGLAVVA